MLFTRNPNGLSGPAPEAGIYNFEYLLLDTLHYGRGVTGLNFRVISGETFREVFMVSKKNWRARQDSNLRPLD